MGQLFASYGVLISLSILGLICIGILILLAVASRSKPKGDDSSETSDTSLAAVKASFLVPFNK